MLVGLLVLIIFLSTALLMFFRKLPALLALPLMAFAIVGGTALITGRISTQDIFAGVMAEGALRLHNAIIVAFFGGMLSFIMQKSGVAERFVRQGAELVGDNPVGVSILVMGIIAVLFTTIGGLGAVIMVATVVMPVLASVGVPPLIAAGIFLFGMSLGGILNAANWVLYVEIMGVPVDVVKSFALVLFTILAITGLCFALIELFRAKVIYSLRTMVSYGAVAVFLLGTILYFVLSPAGEDVSPVVAESDGDQVERRESPPIDPLTADRAESPYEESRGVPAVTDEPLTIGEWIFAVARFAVGGALLLIVLLSFRDILRRVKRWRQQEVEVSWYAYLIPLVPLALILLFDVPIIAAFVIGFLYAILVTLRPGAINMVIQSMLEGSSSVMPAVLLIIGIGMLISAVLGPTGWSEMHDGETWPVLAAVQPLFRMLVPSSFVTYIIGFGIAAPLALYRGPLNVWGLGFGIATILLASPVPFEQSGWAAAVMAMLLTVGQVQGVCDPTNTHNVWLANEVRVDVQAIMWKTLPYVWAMTFVGLTIAAVWYLA